MRYFKDVVRLGLVWLFTGLVVNLSTTQAEMIFAFTTLALALILSFMLDVSDPRTLARARKMLLVEEAKVPQVENLFGNLFEEAYVDADAKPAVNGIPPN